MYTQVASRLYVNTTELGISQAIPTEVYNRARVDFTVFSGTLDQVEIWQSNDLQNWTLLENWGIGGWAGPNYQSPTPVNPVLSAFIRIHWKCETTACTLAGGVNLSSQ